MGASDGQGRRIVVVACLGGGLSTLDSAVNIAFPAILDAFRIDVSSLQWVVISYVLTYAVLLLPFGRLADRVGHRQVLSCGLAVSAVAFAACSIAPTFSVFLATRVAQGVGIALVLAAAPALITLAVSEEARARALGLFQMSVAAGFAAGPVLGGLLLELGSWRGVYLFRLPVALALLALAAVGLDRSRPVAAGRGSTFLALDLPGAVTFATGLAGVLFVTARGPASGWTSPPTLVVSGIAVALLAGFVVIERGAASPLVDLSLFRNPAFAVANVLNALANGAMFTVWLLGPTLLVTLRGHGTISGGLLLGVTALGTAAGAVVAGRVTGRVGTGRLSTLGLALEAVGLVATSRLGESTPTVAVVTAFALVGAGVGLFQVPNLSYVMGSIPRAQQGVASGMAQMVRTVGVLSGVAVTSVAFAARLDAHAGAPGLRDPTTTGFVPAFRDVLLAAALVCAAATALSTVRRRHLSPPGAAPSSPSSPP